MMSLRASCLALVLAAAPIAPAAFAEPPASSSAGYVAADAFRALIDENQEVVEVNLEGPILQAVANSKNDDDPETKALFAKLKAIHAVIGTVKGPASEALGLVQKTDQKLVSAGWQRIARIKDESSTISVLTHMNGDRIDGLVALIFDSDDKELVFANLAGEIDLNRIGEIGDRLHVPGLNSVPGLH